MVLYVGPAYVLSWVRDSDSIGIQTFVSADMLVAS